MKKHKPKTGRAIKVNASNFGSIEISQQTWDKDKKKIFNGLGIITGIVVTGWGLKNLWDLFKIGFKHENKIKSSRLDSSLRSREDDRKFQHHIIEKSLDRKMTHRQEPSHDAEEPMEQKESNFEDTSHWMTAEECISTAEKVEYFANTPIPKGGITALWAKGGVGKTILSVQIAVTIANGKSTGLDINTDGSREIQKVMIYDSENCVSQKLKDYPKAGFSVDNILVKQNCNYSKIEYLGNIICHEIDRATESTTFIVDNITDSVDLPVRNDFRSVKKQIQKAMDNAKARCIVITVIIVSHSESKGERMVGSEIMRDLFTDCLVLKKMEDGKIALVVDKCRNMPCKSVSVHMEDQPYLHWVTDNEGKDPENNCTLFPKERKPVTEEVEDMFLEIHNPPEYGYGSIYKDYKDEYELKSDDTVKNAIRKARKRKAKLTSEFVEEVQEEGEEDMDEGTDKDTDQGVD